MICENCSCKFEKDEGKIYDYDTFICFECQDELVTKMIKNNERGYKKHDNKI